VILWFWCLLHCAFSPCSRQRVAVDRYKPALGQRELALSFKHRQRQTESDNNPGSHRSAHQALSIIEQTEGNERCLVAQLLSDASRHHTMVVLI
jgi:hypothetical protein